MAGVGIQGDVGDHAQFREAGLQTGHGAGRQTLRVVGLGCVQALELGVHHREQGHGRHAQLHAFLGHAIEPVQAHAPHAGHGGHVLDPVFPVQHENRQDQVGGGQGVFPHQAAGELVPAHAAHALAGESWTNQT
jgi:hypothetical protein